MARTVGAKKGRVFTVELRSKRALRNASLGDGSRAGILIEGTLGRLKSAGFVDGVLLEVVGTDGVLRVDLLTEEVLGTMRRIPAGERGVRP